MSIKWNHPFNKIEQFYSQYTNGVEDDLVFYEFLSSYLCMKVGKTPGTAGGPGGRDQTLAVKSLKKQKKSSFFR